jgi:hypothetical protein
VCSEVATSFLYGVFCHEDDVVEGESTDVLALARSTDSIWAHVKTNVLNIPSRWYMELLWEQ